MRQGKLVFAQLSEHLPRSVFLSFAARHAGRYPTLSFSHWDQFLCMMFAQLTARSSLRDIVREAVSEAVRAELEARSPRD